MTDSTTGLNNAYIIDAIRTPFGRYGGGLAPVRADDLGAIPIKALMERNANVDWVQVDDVIYGCANQSGEDNRNVGRMSSLLAGLPYQVPATTVNRLCGSSMDALAIAARAIKAGEANLIIAGGVESMSRAPLVMGKSDQAFGRSQKLEDTTMGWRFINPKLDELYGTETMPQTAENVAEQFNINRADQDAFALRSQQRTAVAQAASSRSLQSLIPESPVNCFNNNFGRQLLCQTASPRVFTLKRAPSTPAPKRCMPHSRILPPTRSGTRGSSPYRASRVKAVL